MKSKYNVKGDLGEKFVNEIAYNSFLKYWCYPNPKFENGNKKEICDLLIIFNNVCIIISVKNYSFKGNHLRYFNKTIEKATRQINGAYNTLFNRSSVEIKHPNKNVEIFPKKEIVKTFKLIINLGEGLDFYNLSKTKNENDFITIFDRDTFETIIQELDTIPDFIDYLEKREDLFKNKLVQVISPNLNEDLNETDKNFITDVSKKTIRIIGTEKDLLSYFIKNKRKFPTLITKEVHDFVLIEVVGAWEEFKSSPNAIKKEIADHYSYFVDKFILNEVLEYGNQQKESIAIELLSLNRLQRRAIGIAFFEFYDKIKKLPEDILYRRFIDLEELGVIFFNYFDSWTDEELQRIIDIIFESYVYYYNYKHSKILLIGINQVPNFVYQLEKNYEKFSVEDEEIIKNNIKELGWFTDYQEIQRNIKEFPD